MIAALLALLTAATPPAADLGKVIRSEGGKVVIEVAEGSGLGVGDRVELLVDRGVDLGLGQTAIQLVRVATGEVTALGPSRAQIQLDLDQDAPLGAVARRTQEPRLGLFDAPRPSGLWHVRVAIRPFIALGDTGFGNVSDVELGRRFEDPIHLQLVIEPLGLATRKAGEAAFAVVATSLILSWDSRSFEVGLGFGGATIHNATSTGAATNAREFGPGFAQFVRLGAVEGVNVTARGLVVLDDADHFALASLHGSLQAPVGSGTWLVLSGGGGIASYVIAEAGVRVLVKGNGTAGSLFLTPSLGAAGAQTDRKVAAGFEKSEAVGLAVGLAAEWRL